MNNNFPSRFAIWTGKSCERSVTTSYLKKVIKVAGSPTEADSNKYICYTNASEFNSSTVPLAFLIFDEEESLDIADDIPLYSVAYNSDRVHLVRHTFFIRSDTEIASYIQRIKDVFVNVCEYPDTNVKECNAIIFNTVPTCNEYYNYIRSIISRSNYKDRAKAGVSVATYFFITPSNVSSYNNIIAKILKCDARHHELKKKIAYSISYANGKVDITPIEVKK
jgi:hypothetical protein